MLRMSVALALSLADIAVPKGALAAAAIASNPLPAGVPTPGQVQSTLPMTPVQQQPKSAPLTSTPPPTSNTIPPGGPTVTVQRFEITGNSVFSSDALRALILTYLGQPLTLADLYKAADVLTRYYQSRGYGLARATIPEQQLTGGSVTLQVVEGRIGKISVEGNTRTHTQRIRKQASAIESGDVYTDSAMDRSSLLVNDLSGVQAQAVLEPGAEFGTADLTYKVTESPEYSGQISFDDYGRADVGRWRLNAEADAASFTGNGDHLSANLTHTEADLLNFGGLAYTAPLGEPGGTMTAGYNQSIYHVSGAKFAALELSGSSRNASVSYQYAQIRSQTDSLYWGFGAQHGLSFSDSKGKVVTETNLNLLQLTGFYTHTQQDGTSLSLSGSFSSNGDHDDGNNADAEFARLELDGSYVHPFAETWTFIGKGSGVWSPDPLSDTEKYSLGGPDNVRGFVSAEARGDSGLFASIEAQHSLAPAWPLSVGWFVESGRVWNKQFDSLDVKTQKTVTTPGGAVTLSSAGMELVFQSTDKRWESRLEWAYAIGGYSPSDGNSGGHIWATFGMNF